LIFFRKESRREETLVAHLLRQSQFEKRIAVELLHARHEKDVIRENRIHKEREILERREKEFQDALDRERELARLAKLEYLEQANKDKEFHDLIAAQRAEAKYKKHYEICAGIVDQIFDLSCKCGEYRELTDDLIPPKMWRDWVNLYKAGKPLYDQQQQTGTIEASETGSFESFDNQSVYNIISDKKLNIDAILNHEAVTIDDEKELLLDDCDMEEYKEMMGEWEPPEQMIIKRSPSENRIAGHIIHRLQNICFPETPGEPAPLFPDFPMKAIVIGKPFAGKSSSLQIVSNEMNIEVIDPQQLIIDAVEVYRSDIINDDPIDEEQNKLSIATEISLDTTIDESNQKTKNQLKRKFF
jgi:hypothetical protein